MKKIDSEESKEAIEFYQGYCANATELEEKVNSFNAEYSFHVHFHGESSWGNVIDFGGRIGEKTTLIKNTLVVEIDKVALKFMRRQGRKCVAKLDDVADGHADTIYCAHVLEHLENPLSYLREFKKKLSPGGRLILVLPYEVNGFFKIKKDTNGHLYAWNPKTASALLARAGFTVKQCGYAAFSILPKIVGWKIYCLLLGNDISISLIRWASTIKCEAMGVQSGGEIIIYAEVET